MSTGQESRDLLSEAPYHRGVRERGKNLEVKNNEGLSKEVS